MHVSILILIIWWTRKNQPYPSCHFHSQQPNHRCRLMVLFSFFFFLPSCILFASLWWFFLDSRCLPARSGSILGGGECSFSHSCIVICNRHPSTARKEERKLAKNMQIWPWDSVFFCSFFSFSFSCTFFFLFSVSDGKVEREREREGLRIKQVSCVLMACHSKEKKRVPSADSYHLQELVVVFERWK